MSVIAIQTELHRVMRIDLDQCNQKWALPDCQMRQY
jgi:hypothetical protein